MKKTMKALTLISAIAMGTTSYAASSANLLLRGVVGLVNDISISPNGTNNTSLDIEGGEAGRFVATAFETSNSPTGYKIMMSSVNGGKLVNTSVPSQFTDYQISYDGSGPTTVTTTPTQIKNVSSLSGLTNDSSLINVDVAALPGAAAGTYEDTVTFSIVAN